jgi:hypothetical protein
MKKLVLFVALLACSGAILAQAEGEEAAVNEPIPAWKKGGVLGVNFSQTHLNNWQGGGQSSINGTVLFNAYINYKQGKWTWDNLFDAAYGVSRLGDLGQLQKTDDRIEINSKLGRTTPLVSTFWTAMFTFRTQWDAGYDYKQATSPLISDPFAPAYIITGLGIDYKPSDKFSMYISPITNKTTIVDNQRLADAGAFGVEAATYDALGAKLTDGQTIRYEVGGFVKLQYSTQIVENVKFSTRADFFSNYLKNPQNIDVNWETLVAMKINKWLSTSITTHVIYDDDIKFEVDRNDDGVIDGKGPRTQFKEVFALGLQFQL